LLLPWPATQQTSCPFCLLICSQNRCLHALDCLLFKFLHSSAHCANKPMLSNRYTYSIVKSVYAYFHCRCMYPLLSVVFLSSLGLSIIQTYRQPLLSIISTCRSHQCYRFRYCPTMSFQHCFRQRSPDKFNSVIVGLNFFNSLLNHVISTHNH
jgi:hypothetical protein